MSKRILKIKVNLPKIQKKRSVRDNSVADLERGNKKIVNSFKSKTHTFTFSTPEQAVNKFDKMKKSGTLKQRRLK